MNPTRAIDIQNGKSSSKVAQEIDARTPPPFISHTRISFSDIVDSVRGKHTRPALRGLKEALAFVNGALVDFDTRPELRLGITIPEARSYVLGSMVQMMKTAGIPRADCKELLKLFKKESGPDDELQEQVSSILEKNGSLASKDFKQLQDIIKCAIDLTKVTKRSQHPITTAEKKVGLQEVQKDLEELTKNFVL